MIEIGDRVQWMKGGRPNHGHEVDSGYIHTGRVLAFIRIGESAYKVASKATGIRRSNLAPMFSIRALPVEFSVKYMRALVQCEKTGRLKTPNVGALTKKSASYIYGGRPKEEDK